MPMAMNMTMAMAMAVAMAMVMVILSKTGQGTRFLLGRCFCHMTKTDRAPLGQSQGQGLWTKPQDRY